jgi:pimeloyl-ACP methyl ester carboxylesterase
MHSGYLWLGALALLIVALVVPYVACKREKRMLDDAARRERGGTYIALEDGVTHYELIGPPRAPVVVLIHGGTIPFYAWDAQVPALLDAGFRVLRYTQFGRGYSDRPAVDYERALYQRQLEQLLDALRIEGSVTLVGVSFGGALAATFTAAHPERVDKLVLIAPVVDYAEGKALFSLAKVPLVAEWYARVFAVRSAVARASGFFEEADADPSYAKRFDAQTRLEGFERALLSFSRTDALAPYYETYAALGDHPTLLIWGTDDPEIAKSHIDYLRKTLKNLRYTEIENAGHGVAVESHRRVNAELTSFLGTGSASDGASK